MFDVFLSHNSVDKPWVSGLKDDLIRYGLSVWLDRDEIRPGDLFAQALEEGLAQSRAVALIISPEAMASGWIKEEYYRALYLAKNKNSPLQLIPVILREAEFPGFVEGRNLIDFRDESSYSENVWKLVWGITGQKPTRVLDLSAPSFAPTNDDKPLPPKEDKPPPQPPGVRRPKRVWRWIKANPSTVGILFTILAAMTVGGWTIYKHFFSNQGEQNQKLKYPAAGKNSKLIITEADAVAIAPVSVKMMNSVWEAYNNKQYQEAIARANELIDAFGNDASEKQGELTAENVEVPPNGKVGESEKEKIFALGTLHEVAAAWWVKGRCLEKLGKKKKALEAYESVAEYTHARVYDPSFDGFWAPGEKAKQRIDGLQQPKN
jgi:hypothetical protein